MAADFEGLLKGAIGLDASTIGAAAVERAVRERQSAIGILSRDEYFGLVSASAPELQALIECVVVPETWFYRDADAFASLRELATRRRGASSTAPVITALSLPCSTGEEPYSMAIALLDAMPAETFRVDGIDISHRSLAHARTGEYRKSAFRGTTSEFRRHYFERIGDRSRVTDEIRRHVTFRHGNLLIPRTLPLAHRYDVVFCRNVLIYFDRPSQEQALRVIGALLAPDGVLFVSPAETGILHRLNFTPAEVGKSAFRLHQRVVPEVPSIAVPMPRRLAPVRRVEPVSAPVRPPAVDSIPTEAPPVVDALDAVARLADEGRFTEAAAQCEAQIARGRSSARLFYLLGLVRDAERNAAEAAAAYRKALYLDPHHHDALLHLAALMDAEHRPAEAARLRRRAQRAADREQAS